MNALIGEFFGTMIMVLLGNGVVAGNILHKTKEEGTGWTAIVLGWGVAVTIAVYCRCCMSWSLKSCSNYCTCRRWYVSC